MVRSAPTVRAALLAGFAFLAMAAPARADRMEPLPKELEGVDITEKLGATVPLDLVFRDESGKPVELWDMFPGDKPVILTLNYSNCPMLCSVQLDGVIDSLRRLEWTVGKEFRILTVSMDPTETPSRASETKEKYLKAYGRVPARDGWRFLTGREQDIRALASAVGFGYRLDEKTGEYHHAAAIILLTPSGKVARYLYGVTYPEETLRLSLVEASEGKVGSIGDKILLFCFKYDSHEGRYSMVAVQVMKLGGLLTLVAMGGTLGVFWARERRRSREGSAT